MKRSEAARYAQWSAVAALCLALVTSGIYLRRQWVAHVEQRNAPPAPPTGVERQSSSLTVSRGEADRTVFTVSASKSTDFKGQDISLLEDVKITVFGKAGDRHDVIHTKSCKYSKSDGGIQCSGQVQMELESAADAELVRQKPGTKPNVVYVDTSEVTFDKATGQARTNRLVKFSFLNGFGDGVGGVYFSEQGTLQLLKDVHVALHPSEESGKGQSGPGREVLLHGTSMEMEKLPRKVVLYGPATATTSTEQLTGGVFTMYMDAQFRAETLVAIPGSGGETPFLVSHGQKENWTLTAEEMTARLAPQGWVREVQGTGHVRGTSPSGELESDWGVLEFWPQLNQAKQATLRGSVRVLSRDPQTGMTRILRTSALLLNFGKGQQNASRGIQHAETLDRGTVDWTDAAGAQCRVTGDRLSVDFSALGKAQQAFANGNVVTQREVKDKPTQIATAEKGTVQLDPQGEWTEITLHGNVHLKQGEQRAESQQAVFVRSSNTAVLTGQPVARDDQSETHAAKLTFHQDTNEVEAEGKVRSTDFSKKKGNLQLSEEPAHITSDHLVGNTQAGRALYTGNARLWQGSSVLEADSIELLKENQVLKANGRVRGVFPQVKQEEGGSEETTVWHVSAGTLTYWDLENRAHLEKNVVVQSTEQRMRAPVLDLDFTHEGTGKDGGPGPAEISRAVGTGGVMVEQEDRRGTAEQGVYTAKNRRFVLSGGTPTLYDATGGTTTGRELTFNLADDTIIVDSGNGSRTMTKHRVQNK